MTPRPPDAPVSEQLKRERVGTALTAARLAYRRSLLDEAYRQCREVLLVHEDSAEAHELMGEILRDQNQLLAAQEEFRRALELDPNLINAEEKIGLISLEQDSQLRFEQRRQALVENAAQRQLEERQPLRAAGLSLFIPGGGQWYNEDTTRAAVLFCVVVGSLLCWLLPTLGAFNEIRFDRPDLIRKGQFPGPGLVVTHLQAKGMVYWWVLLNALVCFGGWLYGVVEAGLTAARETRFLRRQWGIE